MPFSYGAPEVVTFKAFHGTPLRFDWVKDEYRPAPGVFGSLTYTQILSGLKVHTLTAINQATYVFTDSGTSQAPIARQIDPQGNVLDYSYDAQDRLSQVRDPLSGRFLNFDYDAQGRLASVVDPISRSTGFGYDEQGYLSVITDGLNRQIYHIYNDQNLLVGTADSDDEIEKHIFDIYYNRTKSTDKNGHDEIQERNNMSAIIDANGNTTRNEYDAFSNLISTTNSIGYSAIYTYNAYGQVVAVGDEDGQFLAKTYNEFGDLTGMTGILSETTSYEYDALGNRIAVTDPGRYSQNRSDSCHRPVARSSASTSRIALTPRIFSAMVGFQNQTISGGVNEER